MNTIHNFTKNIQYFSQNYKVYWPFRQKFTKITYLWRKKPIGDRYWARRHFTTGEIAGIIET